MMTNFKNHNSRREMENAGWLPTGNGICRDCGADVEWFESPRSKKKLPFNPQSPIPHFQTCSKQQPAAEPPPAARLASPSPKPAPVAASGALENEIALLRAALDANTKALKEFLRQELRRAAGMGGF